MSRADARARVVQARVNLVLDQPFFGALALRLEPRPDAHAQGGMWTDGRTLGYDPERIAMMDAHEITGLLAQHVMRCALGHPWRRGARDVARWSHASERVANTLVREAGMVLPADADAEDAPGLAAEQVYTAMPVPPPAGGQGDDGDGGGEGESASGAESGQGDAAGGDDSPGCGEVRDADAADPAQEAEWAVATIAAAEAARARGQLPAGLARLIVEMRRPRVDWRAALRRFVQSTACADYSWRAPNRRYLASGIYLPELRSEAMPPIVVGIDTSGSIDQPTLDAFAAELTAIAEECAPEHIVVLYCDAEVQGVDEFERNDPIVLAPRGGGGTDFRPVFEHVARDGSAPACLVYLTDLNGTFPAAAPDYHVLWLCTERDRVAPWGETLYLDTEEGA